MELLLNGDQIDLHAPYELMTHLGRLRSVQYAEMRIEADGGSAMVLLKNGDRALVRYLPEIEGPSRAFMAHSGSAQGEQMEFRQANGDTEEVPLASTIHVMEAYQALVYFIRSGGMSEALQWLKAA